MDYYCEVSLLFIKPKNKYKLCEAKIHKEFNKGKHIKLAIENPGINDVNRAFYAYILQQMEKYEYCLNKCEFKLVFNDYQFCPYISSEVSDSKTMRSRQSFLEKVINDFKIIGYNFNRIAEMNILTIAKKWICHMISISNIIWKLLNGNQMLWLKKTKVWSIN